MKPHANPKTQELFHLALRLRAKNASLHEVEIAAARTYPATTSSDGSMRSRLKRLFLAPPQAFERSVRAYEAGQHMHEIISLVPTTSNRGAPSGNRNGEGKRRKPVLPQLDSLWLSATASERLTFIREHGLREALKN